MLTSSIAQVGWCLIIGGHSSRLKVHSLELKCMHFERTASLPAGSRTRLARRARGGSIERVARGVYWNPEGGDVTAHHDLAVVAAAIPKAIICLLSALQFHELTSEWPREVWLALDRQSRVPKSLKLPLRVHRFSKPFLDLGVEEHLIEGMTVRVTSPAKTVADCFRFRNRYGTDLAVEALRDYLKRKLPLELLHQTAQLCRVEKVMRPYLEALL